MTVLAGASTLTALVPKIYDWVPVFGGLVLAVFGASLVAIRPADKAAIAEVQAKKYREARVATDLEAAMNKIRESDPHEIESLRQPVYNEVVREVGQDVYAEKLSIRQQLTNLFA